MAKKKPTEIVLAPVVNDPDARFHVPIVHSLDEAQNTLSVKFITDLIKHYNRDGYKAIEHVYETNPFGYFMALVSLSKVNRFSGEVMHKDGSKPKTIEEILDRVEAQVGPEGRKKFMKFLNEVKK